MQTLLLSLFETALLSLQLKKRFRRIKHWAGFPSEAINWCLADAGISRGHVDHIAINTQPKAQRWRKVAYTLLHRPSPRFLWDRLKNKRQRTGLAQRLSEAFPDQVLNAQLHFVEHHRAHLASAFFASPFQKAAVVSVDGFGDFASSAWGVGNCSTLTLEDHIFFPHSLGVFYTAITQFLGFSQYGDEYKVMGLAPYGKPIFLPQMRQIVHLLPNGGFQLNLRFFTHATQRLPHQWSHGSPVVGTHFSDVLIDLLGPARLPNEPLEQRHMDIARSAQAMYEESFFHLLNAHRRHPLDRLCIAGGCGANSVANGKVTALTPFKQVYVQAAAGDAGGALGAALRFGISLVTLAASRWVLPISDILLRLQLTKHYLLILKSSNISVLQTVLWFDLAILICLTKPLCSIKCPCPSRRVKWLAGLKAEWNGGLELLVIDRSSVIPVVKT